MQVQIVLEQPNTVFTNLDFIRGNIILNLPSTTPITGISVKLEGECRTRLLTPPVPGGDPRNVQTRNETHKILYKVLQVLPGTNSETTSSLAVPNYHTLAAGRYSYQFQFKVPFNNACASGGILGTNVLRSDAPRRHKKGVLPPTLSAFPGMAEIRYFIKCTVNRKEFYKENPRIYQFFTFCPIEPPRQMSQGAESYARRQHHFQSVTMPRRPSKQSTSFFDRMKGPSPVDNTTLDPPSIIVEARLPSPAILTCNEPLPLRLIVKRQNNSSQQLYLQSLQIQIIAHTRISAQEVFRDESHVWMVSNMDRLALPIRNTARIDEEIELDDQAWRRVSLPSSIPPSFNTCSIARKYDLLVQIGVGYGKGFADNVITLPLRHPVEIYSGIRPPAALLAAMSTKVPSTTKSTMPERKPVPPPRRPSKATEASSSTQAGVMQGQGAAAGPSNSTYQAPFVADEDEEPPPSYEDAVAQSLPPVDGQRGRYQPPPVRPSEGFGMDKDD